MKKRLLTIATILVASIGLTYAYTVAACTTCGIWTYTMDLQSFIHCGQGQDENDYKQYLMEINYEKCGDYREPTIYQ